MKDVCRSVAGILVLLVLAGCSSRKTVREENSESLTQDLVQAALREAYASAYDEKWDAALRKIEWILRVDPDYSFARHLRERLEEWRSKSVNRQSLVFALEAWTKNAGDAIPFRDSFHSPPLSSLELLLKEDGAPEDPRRRQPKGLTLGNVPASSEDYAHDAAIYRTFETTRITLTGGTTFAYFVDGLAFETKLSIQLDQAARELLVADCKVDLWHEFLGEAFRKILGPLGLAVTVKGGWLFIGAKRSG